MIKIYGSKEREAELIAFLAEFPRVRVYLSYPLRGRTRKVRIGQAKGLYKVHNFPIT